MATRSFRLQSSYYLAVLLLAVHGGAIACLCLLPWAWWAKLLLALACLASFATLFRQYALLNDPRSIVEFWQQSTGHWRLRDNLAEVRTARLVGNSIYTRYFVLLNFDDLRQGGRRVSVLVFSDSLSAHDFKQLRRRLSSLT